MRPDAAVLRDVSLGRRWREAGRRMAFVARPVVTAQGATTLGQFLRHRLRWLRTWRRVAGPTWPPANARRSAAAVPARVRS